jgi:hypothetical protein
VDAAFLSMRVQTDNDVLLLATDGTWRSVPPPTTAHTERSSVRTAQVGTFDSEFSWWVLAWDLQSGQLTPGLTRGSRSVSMSYASAVVG